MFMHMFISMQGPPGIEGLDGKDGKPGLRVSQTHMHQMGGLSIHMHNIKV